MNKSGLGIESQLGQASELRQQLLRKLDDAVSEDVRFPMSINVPAPHLNPWHWLNANADMPRLAWSDRSSPDLYGGIGIAAQVDLPVGGEVADAVARCRQWLGGNRTLKFFGGISFDGNAAWNDFGAGKFVLPRFAWSHGEVTLAVMNLEDLAAARHELQRVKLDTDADPMVLPSPCETTYLPSAEGWQTRVDEALALIRSEAVEKIVLSRQAILKFEEELNPIGLASKLDAATHDCYVFCFNFAKSSAFVGATPERLFFRERDLLWSEVVAGTRKRGRNAQEDRRLAAELLASDKDQREHDIVRKSIRQKLHKYIDHLSVDDQASILKLARKQHLRSNVHGQLKPGVNDGMLLQRLHPTPAVGGYPTDNALPEIARIEPFSRGWYAAPVGWVGSESAQFAVAIRSGLIAQNTLSLFSGAGIVRGSIPEEEWQEVENKIQDFMSVLG